MINIRQVGTLGWDQYMDPGLSLRYTPGIWQYAGGQVYWLQDGKFCDLGLGQLLL